MTDIVERLRARWDDPSQFDVDCKEAADKIEQLQTALEEILDFVERCREAGCPNTYGYLDSARKRSYLR